MKNYYQCPECGSFNIADISPTNMNSDLNTRLSEKGYGSKPYKCYECERSFGLSSLVKKTAHFMGICPECTPNGNEYMPEKPILVRNNKMHCVKCDREINTPPTKIL